uniref:Secreted protein n=1 Tax=Anopheles dirus TaxID=7168 RepID=A0A182NLD7_9DIPT
MYRTNQSNHLLLLLLLLPLFQLIVVGTAEASAIARWPALDFKSDRAFYPLMVSFSRYPFHDVYETNPGSLLSTATKYSIVPSAPPMVGRAMLPKARKPFFTLPGGHQRDWRHQGNVRTSSKNVCQGLIYLPQQLEASGRRMFPPKMRKLMKYCGFI